METGVFKTNQSESSWVVYHCWGVIWVNNWWYEYIFLHLYKNFKLYSFSDQSETGNKSHSVIYGPKFINPFWRKLLAKCFVKILWPIIFFVQEERIWIHIVSFGFRPIQFLNLANWSLRLSITYVQSSAIPCCSTGLELLFLLWICHGHITVY